jgi:predicted DNA-binding transcriptional regulator YafY
LLGFGPYAFVQAPKSLAQELKAEFCAACGSYGIRCPGQA